MTPRAAWTSLQRCSAVPVRLVRSVAGTGYQSRRHGLATGTQRRPVDGEVQWAAALRLLERFYEEVGTTRKMPSMHGWLGAALLEAGCGRASCNSSGNLEEATPLDMRPEHEGHIPAADAPRTILDADGNERSFLYNADGYPVKHMPIVQCAHWDSATHSTRDALLEEALAGLRLHGFVVLERLLPRDRIQGLDEEFRRYKEASPEGVTFSRMRASRDMTIPPFTGVWVEDWLVRHPLVLALIARYLRNSLDMSNEEAAHLSLAQWIAAGASIDEFLTGSMSAGFPILDLLVVVDTPAGAAAQTRHRDTIMPGPCASLGVHIPLTPLELSPLNGSIGFVPGSHRLQADTREVVGAVPQGSVVLYDSFTEHHGLENHSDRPRSALFAWYRVPGVYSGHTQENFGTLGLEMTTAFRRHVGQRLDVAVDAERRRCPSHSGGEAQAQWGFQHGSPLVQWGEERVCFSCNKTTGEGALSSGLWFCTACWGTARKAGDAVPTAAPSNLEAPPQAGTGTGRFSEERLQELEASGMNIRASRGRHKLTLLRERGHFLPIDPSSDWLARISTEPQPQGWRDALRKAMGEIPRQDGF